MTTEEIIAILLGTGGGTGLLVVIWSLFKNFRTVYRSEKLKGYSTLQALNTAIRYIYIRKDKPKPKKK